MKEMKAEATEVLQFIFIEYNKYRPSRKAEVGLFKKPLDVKKSLKISSPEASAMEVCGGVKPPSCFLKFLKRKAAGIMEPPSCRV
ncbi:hypothetical protein LXL04_008295 [Taraxacum kok-saghyz]